MRRILVAGVVLVAAVLGGGAAAAADEIPWPSGVVSPLDHNPYP